MNQHLKTIQDLLQQNKTLSDAEKETLLKRKTITEADKQWSITDFKLDRTEKVKKTTAILLEETIEELEQKRKAVEAQNHELAIESSLERVRTVAMSMIKPDDLLNICKAQFTELKQLGFGDIRNALIGIFHDDKNYVGDYDYSDFSGGRMTTIPYGKNAIVDRSLAHLKSAKDAFTEFIVEGKDLEEWKAFRKQNGEYDDSRIETADALYYYFYSIGSGNIGISTFQKISDEQLAILKRFRNVFDLAYRRYVDISNAAVQAKEARIETALERVRAVAMAMKQSDELVAVSEVMYKELTSLGFSNIRNAQIAIENDERQSFISYVHSDQEPHAIREAPYSSSSLLLKAKQELGTSGAFYETEYTGKELDDWRDWKKRTGAPLESRELTAASLRWYLYSIGKGHIGISTFDEISAEQVEIVKRFKNVFELSYRRFDDLQKAEAQAKEAQIEAALERVRSRSMAMQKSEELKEVIQVVYEQFVHLNMLVEHTGFIMDYKERNDMHIWLADKHAVPFQVTIPYFDCSHWNSFNEAKAKGRDFFANHLNFEEKNKFYRELFGLFPVPDETKEYYFSCPGLAISTVLLDNVGLYIENFSGIPYTNEENNTLLRFGKVFQQTYTRFLDLQKAEAQAREAKIEAALEKVRSRSLAVHQSEEFKEVIRVVFEKLKELEIPVGAASINIFGEGSKDTDVYACGHNENGLDIRKVRLRYFDHPIANDLYNAHKNGLDFFVGSYGMKEKNSYYEYQFKHADLKELPDEIKERILQAERYSLSMAPAKNSVIIINNFEGKLLSDTEADIVRRFSRVFEQAYTRFLDLQKAEAQARESQIQLALERVRARTMAMQHSDELREAAALLFQQVKSLGVPAYSCGYNIWEKDDKEFTSWMSTQDGSDFNAVLNIPLTVDANFIRFAESRKKGEQFFVLELRGKRMQEHYQYLKTIPAFKAYFDYAVSVGFDLPETQIHHLANFSQGNLLFITLEPCPEFHDVFKRFSAVFEQTYTRFLDLQNAEAQAREAQIQLAMERIRARTMAMQKSEELAEVSALLFQQMKSLEINSYSCGFTIWDNNTKDLISWMCNADGSMNPPFRMPIVGNAWHILQYESWKNGEDFILKDIAGKELQVYFRYLRSFPLLDAAFEKSVAAGHPMPERQVHNIANFSHGNLLFITLQPCPEAHDSFKRFAKVFEQTYTRFLDLQRAEAQAREARIEAALERTRTQSMIMQHSKELDNTLRVFHEQILSLGIHSEFSYLWLPDEDKGRHIFWAAWAETLSTGQPGKDNSIVFKSKAVNFPLDRTEPATAQCLVDWKSDESIYSYVIPPAGVENYFATWKELLEGVERLKPAYFRDGLYYVEAFMKYGCFGVVIKNELLDDEKKILLRFSVEFERTYTRFLDLQKAEGQAREAQIEAALEKIRSRSLAMHQSNELEEVIMVVSEQLQQLQFRFHNASFVRYNEQQGLNFWLASPGQPQPYLIEVPYLDNPIYTRPLEALKNGVDFIADVLTAEENHEWVAHLLKYSVLKNVSEDDKKFLRGTTGFARSLVLTKHIILVIGNYGAVPYTDEQNQILKRFGYVFEQAYTRFLDLQKAEAQTREAQIELGLERVRARAMAMQNSVELKELIGTVFVELTKLDLVLTRCVIMIYDTVSNDSVWWMANSEAPADPIGLHIKYHDHAPYLAYVNAWREKNLRWTYVLEGADKKSWDDFLFTETELSHLPDFVIAGMKAPDRVYLNASFNSFGNLTLATLETLSEAHFDIMLRFAKVFDLTYTRFNDLQKAEAQVKESQIEAALERVRSKTMAMHKTDELQGVVRVVAEELKNTGVILDTGGAVICTYFQDSKDVIHWTATEDPAHPSVPYLLPYFKDELFDEAWASKNRGDDYFAKEFSYEVKNAFFNHAFEHSDYRQLPNEYKKIMLESKSHGLAWAWSKNSAIMIPSIQGDLPSEEEKEILVRFAKVFEQSFIRFLDLQKSEAQARESQIQLAMERVRARTMAMQKSEELPETSHILFEQMKELGEPVEQLTIGVVQEENKVIEISATLHGDILKKIYQHSLDEPFMMSKIYHAWKTHQKTLIVELKGDELNAYNKYRNELTKSEMFPTNLGDEHRRIVYAAFFSKGMLALGANEPRPPESLQLLERFAGVFDQAYIRFIDLKKAEAQTKESQIEAALERVRSRTMAMHRSEEIADILGKIFTELRSLDLVLNRVLIWIFNPEEKYISWWSANPEVESNAESYRVDYNEHPVFLTYFDAWQKKIPLLLYTLGGDMKSSWEDHLFKNTELSKLPKAVQDGMRSEKSIFTTSAISDYGLMMAGSFEPLSNENNDIIQRFGRVFQQSFTRYVDVQKAEAQTREATIEAALERVRGKAMAMHSSKDLATTIGVFYHELEALNLTPRRCGVGLIDKEKQTAEISTMNASADGEGIELVGNLDLRSHPVLTSVYNNWLTKTEYHPVLRGNEIKDYYQIVRPQISFPDYPNDTVQYGYFFFFEEGGVYAWTEKELNEEELKIYRRFTSVLSLTYKRYKDLKDAEVRAQTAIKDAALDRIRADIASMRTINDLDRITPLIWNELTVLGIPFIRCGVFIMDEDQELIHTFLSTPDGRSIAAFHLPYDTPGNIGKVLDHWRNKENYIDHWDEKEFHQFAEILAKQGALDSAENYLKTIPHGGFALHFLPFLQGMLYVGNTTQLNDEQIELIQHVANAFSTAYARYEDFNKLEAAKKQVDNTLNELQVTQKQLIQSEKMASLGELTAGIAHEIQNPLNFVNNFSDVSHELLEEMKTELEKGNKEDAMAIAEDVKQNLEKILHHGKRADAIVKGMLQHSRAGSGQKELTDINVLADEYLRLAYHGLRAKDKSFNAALHHDFDKSIDKVNVIPQDIGRVLVNLINNAFYAVNVKARKNIPGYEPALTITTKKIADKVELKVSDNGIGIPPKVLDKIFHPFFTTKPTGQGTGLGLSMAYDIITKGHGGELKVKTKEGEGSEFCIQIPVSKTPA